MTQLWIQSGMWCRGYPLQVEVKGGIQLWSKSTKCQLFLCDIVGAKPLRSWVLEWYIFTIISVHMLNSTIFPEQADSWPPTLLRTSVEASVADMVCFELMVMCRFCIGASTQTHNEHLGRCTVVKSVLYIHTLYEVGNVCWMVSSNQWCFIYSCQPTDAIKKNFTCIIVLSYS